MTRPRDESPFRDYRECALKARAAYLGQLMHSGGSKVTTPPSARMAKFAFVGVALAGVVAAVAFIVLARLPANAAADSSTENGAIETTASVARNAQPASERTPAPAVDLALDGYEDR